MNDRLRPKILSLASPGSSMIINEIFYSIQGESSYTGWPCAFIRLSGCDLRCSYCDTQYAFNDGRRDVHRRNPPRHRSVPDEVGSSDGWRTDAAAIGP